MSSRTKRCQSAGSRSPTPAFCQAFFSASWKKVNSLFQSSALHLPPSKWPQAWLPISWPSSFASQISPSRSIVSSRSWEKPTLERPRFSCGA